MRALGVRQGLAEVHGNRHRISVCQLLLRLRINKLAPAAVRLQIQVLDLREVWRVIILVLI